MLASFRVLSRLWPVALLLLALLSFGGSWVADRYRELPGNAGGVHPDVGSLQRLVSQAAATAGREAALVALDYLPPADPGFARLRAEVSYPTFVNVDSVLVAWSASGPEPTPADWADLRPERLAETEQGKFLVVRRALGRVRVLAFVPLARHYGISNRYLRDGAEPALLQGLDVQVQANRPAPGQASGRVAKIFGQRGQYLFSLVQEPGSSTAERTLPLVLGLLGLVFWLAGWAGLAWQLWRQGRVLLGVGLGLGALAATRLALLYLGMPFAWVELPLFDPRVYAVSNWAPSLGDLLLNAMLGLLLALGALLLSRHYDLPGRARRAGAFHWGPVAWLLLLGGLLRQYMYYNSTFSNSQLNLDVTQSIQVSSYRLVLLLAVVVNTAAYVIAFLLLTELLAPDLRRLRQSPLRWAGPLGALVLVGVGSVLAQPALVLPGLLVLYLVMVRVCGLDEPVRPPGGRYLSVLLALGLAAGTGALAEYEQFEHQLVQDKQRLANNLLIDNDLQGEFLLGQRLRLLGADPTVARLLAGGPARAEVLRRRISRQYLSSYFDKYEENIELFDPDGRPYGNDDGDTLTFNQLRERLTHLATPTDQAGVYLLKSDNSFSSRRYVAVVPVGRPPQAGIGPPAPVGTILLTLSLKQLASYSVLPELLVDQKFFQPGLATDLSYAGYTNGQLVYSQGEFDYANSLPAGVLRDPAIYNKGMLLGGYHHLAVRGSQGRTVVVTTTTYSWADGLSNFSVLLLANVLAWLLVLGVAALLGRGWRNVAFNFSTRIQLLLNIGVLLPLLVVSLATASQVTSSYRRDLHRFYERRGHLALESLLRRREQLADTTARPALVAMVRNVAALTETDLNLYDTRGQLLVSSQPLIFEAGLLGPLLNPQAVVDLRERGLSRTLLTERAGSLYFTSLYLPVRATEASGGPNGPVIAYVGIPFFDSQKELDGKLSDLITTTINIFTVMFLLFLALALVATRQLTAPLKLLTQRLMRTTLTGQNEVLDYRSTDDEIGLLVREYNSMLGKLEESKRELAAQEKEAAWREMARQVAHEIKNPLTPMKLSLQYLQKAIAEQRPNVEELIGRISQTLITQVDVLSDIATSFSTFTNLPTMRPERLDVAQVLRECTDLFLQTAGTDGGDLRLQLPTPNGHPLTVFADESLLVRTFNNLLLNARQAVPDGRHPHLNVTLAEASNRVLITIQDNGAGIDEEVRDKIFKPNFTTKATGSGIGLAVAKRGIESAGGRIWFETAPGEGTSFFIELPLAG